MRAVPHFDLWWEFEFETEVETSMGWIYARGKLDGGCREDALKFEEVLLCEDDDVYSRHLSWSEHDRFRGILIQREVFNHVNELVQKWAKGGEG